MFTSMLDKVLFNGGFVLSGVLHTSARGMKYTAEKVNVLGDKTEGLACKVDQKVLEIGLKGLDPVMLTEQVVSDVKRVYGDKE